MNQTIWISPNGQVVNCPPNEHYTYMQNNFQNLFGHQPLNESVVHDTPYEQGWVHIQNHFGSFNVRGNQVAVQKQKNIIRNLIFDRLMTDRNFNVNIEYNNKANINPYGSTYSFKMPDQYNDLKSYLV